MVSILGRSQLICLILHYATILRYLWPISSTSVCWILDLIDAPDNLSRCDPNLSWFNLLSSNRSPEHVNQYLTRIFEDARWCRLPTRHARGLGCHHQDLGHWCTRYGLITRCTWSHTPSLIKKISRAWLIHSLFSIDAKGQRLVRLQ